MGLFSAIGGAVAKGLDYLTAGFVHPIKTIEAAISPTKTIQQDVITPHFEQSFVKQTVQTLTAGATYAGAVLGGAAIGTAAKAGTIGTTATKAAAALIPTTIKGKIIAAVAAPVVVGALVQSPGAVIGAVAKAPGELAQFGADVSSFAVNPSISSAIEIVKESPLISAGAAALGVGAAAGLVIPAVSGILTREEMQKQTEAFERQAAAAESGLVAGTGGSATLPKEKLLITDDTGISTPQTTTISTGKRRRKRAIKKESPSVRQNVQVIVKNAATGLRIRNERYLNTRVLS